ncbi:MAG: N-acetylmuramoyl-L-alanine amidase [Acidimicrobiia bacterium]|nr:N-acetylmuramoyl-L-alanine amidase [Acidimicrobiia bacterium]
MALLPWLVEVATTAGYPVVVVDGWEDRGAPTMQASPAGALYHHTAGPAEYDTTSDFPSLYTLLNGNATTPPPLSHYGVGYSGTIYVIAAGKCNHAGLGSWPGVGTSEDGSGSPNLIGVEVEHPGVSTEPWPDAQRDSVRRLFAAIAAHLGADTISADTDTGFVVLGHKEWAANPPGWPGRKIDPISTDMDDERALMAALLEDDVTVEELEAVLRSVIPELVAAEVGKLLAEDIRETSPLSRSVWGHRGVVNPAGADPGEAETVRRKLDAAYKAASVVTE